MAFGEDGECRADVLEVGLEPCAAEGLRGEVALLGAGVDLERGEDDGGAGGSGRGWWALGDEQGWG